MASEEVIQAMETVSMSDKQSREASATSSVESAAARAASAHPDPSHGRSPNRSDLPQPSINGTTEGDHDSGVDESTQGGSGSSQKSHGKVHSRRLPADTAGKPTPPRSRPSRNGLNRSGARSQSVPKPFSTFGAPSMPEKKVPMNKVKVGMSSSPNLKQIRSKVGSMNNTTYKPGGGEVKIESRKLEWKSGARTQAKNDGYAPKGGEKKIESRKLAWNATSKIGSLANTTHRPGGGERKIQSQKLDWKADSKVGSTQNLKHKPGGGQVKILSQRLPSAPVKSKVGSLANVKHKPSGGDKKVFNDVEYMRQTSASHSTYTSRNSSRRQSGSQTPEPLPLSVPTSQLDIEI